jgi:hypothetical protein
MDKVDIGEERVEGIFIDRETLSAGGPLPPRRSAA